MSKWISFKDSQPDSSKRVLLMFYGGIVCSGRKRYGNLGEPSQDTFAWRCDCCGRFGNPTHWVELVI